MLKRSFYFAFLLVASWCVMTFTHESGHILGGWGCGGTLQQADLAPWHLPHSRFDPDPQPLITLWAGPILGVVVPLTLALLLRRAWAWFIAYFCLLANGSYLATAWISGERYLDTARLLEQGTHPVTIALYCVLTIPTGYWGFRQQCVRVFAGAERKKHPSAG